MSYASGVINAAKLESTARHVRMFRAWMRMLIYPPVILLGLAAMVVIQTTYVYDPPMSALVQIHFFAVSSIPVCITGIIIFGFENTLRRFTRHLVSYASMVRAQNPDLSDLSLAFTVEDGLKRKR